MNEQRRQYILAGFVSLITLLVYLSALRNDFVIWDDEYNVYNNLQIRSLNWAFFRWAFTDISLSYWQPINWMSYAIDYATWGLNPAGYHLTNILLHAANTFVVVVLAVRLLEFDRCPTTHDSRFTLIAAGTTGTLFGLHPLHVESVAWVSGRTDLLCSFFFLVSVIAYIRYVCRGGPLWPPEEGQPQRVAPANKDSGQTGITNQLYLNRQYLLSLAFFVLALASKPSAVTLPAVLLILDYYPLHRLRSWKSFRAACIEKFPFIVLSLIVSAEIFWGEKAHGRMALSGESSFTSRGLVAFKALMMYLRQMVAPINLSPFYPYPEKISFLSIEYLAGIVLACGITVAGILLAKRQKILLIVWGCYLITLLPVIDVIKVREVYMADRYVYLPIIGPLLLMGCCAAWVWMRVASLRQQRSAVKLFTFIVAISLCIALSYLTLKQIAVWKNGINLWNSVIEKEPYRIPTAYLNRGLAFRGIGQTDRALEDINTAITLAPTQSRTSMAYTYRGIIFKDKDQINRAIEDYTKAITINPKYADAYANRGIAFNETGQFSQAIQDFDRAIALDPAQYMSYIGRGAAFKEMGQPDRAIEDYTAAITINPGYADAYTYRGIVFKETGRFNRALEDYNAAIRLKPSGVEAYNDRGVAYKHLGQLDMAIEDYSRAIALNPSFYLAYCNRGMVFSMKGQIDRAIEDYTRALTLNPGFVKVYIDRGGLYEKTGNRDLAAADYQKACDLGSEAGCYALRTYRKR